MKFKFLAFIAFVAITLASCDWFNAASENKSSLIGTWKLDSISSESKQENIGLLFLAMAMQNDSVEYKFTNDSIYYTGETPVAYQINKEKSEIILKDSANTKINFQLLNDSLLRLTSTDSVLLYLIKKK